MEEIKFYYITGRKMKRVKPGYNRIEKSEPIKPYFYQTWTGIVTFFIVLISHQRLLFPLIVQSPSTLFWNLKLHYSL